MWYSRFEVGRRHELVGQVFVHSLSHIIAAQQFIHHHLRERSESSQIHRPCGLIHLFAAVQMIMTSYVRLVSVAMCVGVSEGVLVRGECGINRRG